MDSLRHARTYDRDVPRDGLQRATAKVTVLVVVVGVTSHQGGQESWSQGKGAQVVTSDTPSRYAKCGAPKGSYLSTSLEGCDHWKAQCGESRMLRLGRVATRKSRM